MSAAGVEVQVQEPQGEDIMSAGGEESKVQQLIALGVAQFELYRHLLTPDNVALGVVALLGFAGAMHALPGLPARMQAKQMGIPGWFIICAGLLMLGSSALYHLRPAEGLYAVSLCMGGAFATAAKMPSFMHRPGGMVFSCLTLAAALWVSFEKNGQLSTQVWATCAACFLAGIVGRIIAPTNPTLVKMLQREKAAEPEKKKAETAKPVEKGAPGKGDAAKVAGDVATAATPARLEGQKMPSKSDANTGGARKRVESPAPRPQA